MAEQRPATARAKQRFESPGHYTDKDREKIDESSFAGPHRSFPILTQQDVYDAAKLIGHADDPAAVKARIKSIAKKRGFKLPDSWEAEEEGGRAMGAEVTRATDPAGITRVVLPSEIRIVDQERREVELCGTSEAVDTFGTIFSYEASKDAFSRWMGNLREMHQPKAVGRKIDVRFDDTARKVYVHGRISRGAEDTWEKLLDGTLQGASIGASNVRWERQDRGGKIVPVATKYDLVELSLVDAPSNGDALGVTFIRAAQIDPDGILEPVNSQHAQRGPVVDLHNRPGFNQNQAQPTPHDPFAAQNHPGSPAQVSVPAGTGAGFGNVIITTTQETPADILDTPLRDVDVEGADSPFPQQPIEDDQGQQRPLDGPPDALSDGTPFGASRPMGVLGSHTDHDAASQMGGLSAPLHGNPGTPGFDGTKQVLPQGGGPGSRAAQPAGAGARSRDLGASVAALASEAAPAAAPEPQLAPFGYGQATPVNRGHLPSKAQLAQVQRAAERAAEDAIRLAGDMAEASFPVWDQREDYPIYLKRRMEARGRAERDVILDQKAQEIAAAEATRIQQQAAAQPQQPVAPWPPQPVAAGQNPRARAQAIQANQQAQRAQAAEAQRVAALQAEATRVAEPAQSQEAYTPEAMARLIDERVAARLAEAEAARGGVNSAIVPTAPKPSMSNDGALAALGMNPVSHSHGHDHDGSVLHGTAGDHGHQHTHMDGTSHAHPHLHQHDHHDHHGELRAAGLSSHDHTHVHLHEHSHTYRSGEPTDTRLVLAEASRTRQQQPLEAVNDRPVNPFALQPVTGSAQSAGLPVGQAPQMSVHPAAAGHLDLLNTEDANALGFGVPPEVIPVPTPDDLEITDPAGFHEGGHDAGTGAIAGRQPIAPANKAFVKAEALKPTSPIANQPAVAGGPNKAAQLDQDSDHDADEDAAEAAAASAAAATKGGGSLPGLDKGERPQEQNIAIVPTPTVTGAFKLRAAGMDADDAAGGGDNDAGTAAAGEEPNDGGEETAPPAKGKGGVTITETRPSAAMKAGKRAEEADTTRIGARVSAESRQALHAARGVQEQAIRSVCAHCGCSNCAAYTAALDHIASFAEQGGNLNTPAEASGRAAFADHLAHQQQAALTAVLSGLAARFEALAAGVTSRFADLELNVANLAIQTQQSHLPTDTTRSQAVQQAEETRLAALAQNLTERMVAQTHEAVERLVAPIAQQVEAFAADAAGTRELVERIAEQPQPGAVGGPVAGAADKFVRFLEPGTVNGAPTGGAAMGAGGSTYADPAQDPEVQIRAIQAAAVRLTNPAQMTQLAAIVATLQPNGRPMVAGGTQTRLPQRQLANRVPGQGR